MVKTMKPIMDKLTKEKLQCAKCVLRDFVYDRLSVLNLSYAVTEEPVPFVERLKLNYQSISEGEVWSDRLWDCGWFHATGKVPSAPEGKALYVALDFEGEGCVFDKNGKPLRGITNVSSEFDRELGFPGKRYIKLSELTDGDEIDLWIETGNNDLFGNLRTGKVKKCSVVSCDEERRSLFYDYSFLLNLAESVPADDPLHYTLVYALEKVALLGAMNMSAETVAQCRAILKPHLERKNTPDPLLTFYAVGHSHLDLAWLWPLRETRRKAGRTFATAIANLKEYPKYNYGASQPQQFEWVKHDYPALYDEVKEAVKEGRFEVQGGMWVEADTNLTGGESLVRQFLYGKKFWKKEFGKEVETLWLPDVFGFSGALPQIMRGCGCRNFLTIKLSWNMVNEFPYHSFKWQGIDGSEVLAHMPPEGTYNSSASPKALRAAAGNYAQRGLSKNALMLYGIGDGGGGPGREHLEFLSREGDLYGIPNVKSATSEEFFNELRKEINRLPTYKGEIYLERHQGTYTSQSDSKYYNRKTENALAAYEFAQVLTGNIDREGTERLWKEVLLYQFHDILPGSSIKRVYDESVVRYKQMLDEITERTKEAFDNTGNELCVINYTSFKRNEYVSVGGEWYRAEADSYSVSELKKAEGDFSVYADETKIGNALIEAKISENGTIISVKNKKTGREALRRESGEFLVFDDAGNAWDFYYGYRRGITERFEKVTATVFQDGATAGIRILFRYGKSTLEETISVNEESPLVRCDLKVDWRETEKMLRTDFYPAVETDEVTCDIQWGSVKRSMLTNNSEQTAQYEMCAHKWVDMSSLTYGVAVINNGKYGYSCKDGCISIDLLRSQKHPCVDQDKGEHTFAYAIYAHEGNVYDSDVAAQAYAFNRPLIAVVSQSKLSLVSTDNPHMVIETVKPAEDGSGYVVRLYNDRPDTQTARLTAEGNISVTDMLENEIGFSDGELMLRGFEIVTLKIK